MRAFKDYNDLYERISKHCYIYSKEELKSIILDLIFNHENGSNEEDTIHEINESLGFKHDTSR